MSLRQCGLESFQNILPVDTGYGFSENLKTHSLIEIMIATRATNNSMASFGSLF